MRILTEKDETVKTCETCGTQFAYTESDIQYGEYGCPYITCPGCGTKLDLFEHESEYITLDTVEYPRHFSSFAEGIKISDEECAKFVKEVCQFLKSCKEGEPVIIGTGNTIVIGVNMEDEHRIIVAKNYETLSLDKEWEEDHVW